MRENIYVYKYDTDNYGQEVTILPNIEKLPKVENLKDYVMQLNCIMHGIGSNREG